MRGMLDLNSISDHELILVHLLIFFRSILRTHPEFGQAGGDITLVLTLALPYAYEMLTRI